MSKDMLGSLTRALVAVPQKWLGLLLDIVNKLMSNDGETFYRELAKFVRNWKMVAETAKDNLLSVISDNIVILATERFVAKDHFKKGNAGIYWIGDNFKEWFIDKMEDARSESFITSLKLLRNSRDIPIITELGGEEKCETTLAEMFEMLKRQHDGREGDLLVNGYANIFYICDKDDTLRAVYAFWDAGGGGWFVSAFLVEDPYGWDAGGQVVSRK